MILPCPYFGWPIGDDPTTFCSTSRCANQLSYDHHALDFYNMKPRNTRAALARVSTADSLPRLRQDDSRGAQARREVTRGGSCTLLFPAKVREFLPLLLR